LTQGLAEVLGRRFLTPTEALGAIEPLAKAAGFIAKLKKQHEGTHQIYCNRAGKVPVKRSEICPDAKPRNTAPCIMCNCQWRLKVMLEAGSLENTQHANAGRQWRIVGYANSPVQSLTEGHNHDLVVAAEPQLPASVGRIISKAELTADIITNVEALCLAPSMRGKTLQQAVVSMHFGGDFTAVFEAPALHLLNNLAAKVATRLAFTKGDCKEFINELNGVAQGGGYAKYELTDDCTFKRAFWATKEQLERAMEFGLDVIQQVRHRLHQLDIDASYISRKCRTLLQVEACFKH
jgi:hypothetical protein